VYDQCYRHGRLSGDNGTMPMSTINSALGGANRSPDLAWSGAQAGTQSCAVTIYDPDAPTTVGWVHLTLFNLSPGTTRLEAGAGAAGKNPPGSTLGLPDVGVSEYGGPLPRPATRHITTRSPCGRWTCRRSSAGPTRHMRSFAF
jgi:Raf kinase inhibitor-like YbhB/YbcL family protein